MKALFTTFENEKELIKKEVGQYSTLFITNHPEKFEELGLYGAWVRPTSAIGFEGKSVNYVIIDEGVELEDRFIAETLSPMIIRSGGEVIKIQNCERLVDEKNMYKRRAEHFEKECLIQKEFINLDKYESQYCSLKGRVEGYYNHK